MNASIEKLMRMTPETVKKNAISEAQRVAQGKGLLLAGAEVAVSAFGYGVAAGRWGKGGSIEFWSIPLDLAVGSLLHVAGLVMPDEKYSDHVHNVANGLYAYFAAREGAAVGAMLKARSEGAPAGALQAPAGAPPAVKGYGVGYPGMGNTSIGAGYGRRAMTPEQVANYARG